MQSVIRLNDIPDGMLPVICHSDNSDKHVYLNHAPVEEIFIFNNQYRVNVGGKNFGQYRYPLDTDVCLEVY